ncbi:MAG TPA: glycosyltransferase family 39 protein [Verrucomicrobiae bacterium]
MGPLLAQLKIAVGYLAKRLPALAVFLAVIIGFQWQEEAYRSEFGAEPDEAAHYVTGLMVRDYIAAGCPGNPLKFANKFYEHYPKVALGHWPPVFYAAQAAWTLPFGASRESILVFMAVLTALLAWTSYLVLERLLDARWAWFGGLLLLLLPQIHQYGGLIMMEIPMSLLTLWGALAYARYLENGAWQASLAYGLIASATILTKYAGLALAFVPLVGLVLCARWAWLKRFSFWLPAGAVVVLCVPWIALTLKMASDGMAEEKLSLGFILKAAPYFIGKIEATMGIALLAFALVGLIASWAMKPLQRPVLASLIGLMTGTYLLYLLVPAGLEARHMTPILAPAIIFALLGMKTISELLVQKGMAGTTACALTVAVGVAGFAIETFRLKPKGYRGYEAIAQKLQAEAPEPKTIVLVSSDARGEGMFVSEVALGEKRLDTIAKRASKLLAKSGWAGGSYEAKAKSAEETFDILEKEGVQFLIIDRTIPARLKAKHHELLENAVAAAGDKWKLVGKYPITRADEVVPEGLEIYRLK